jgi:hypothetical protein
MLFSLNRYDDSIVFPHCLGLFFMVNGFLLLRKNLDESLTKLFNLVNYAGDVFGRLK